MEVKIKRFCLEMLSVFEVVKPPQGKCVRGGDS